MMSTMLCTENNTTSYCRGSERAKTTIPDPHLIQIWEHALGRRFRELPRNRQGAVIAAIGCDEAFSCPLVEAYGLSAVLGNWTAEESVAMQPYGVTFAAYKAFLAWNDSASEIEIHLCRTWLVAQMEERV